MTFDAKPFARGHVRAREEEEEVEEEEEEEGEEEERNHEKDTDEEEKDESNASQHQCHTCFHVLRGAILKKKKKKVAVLHDKVQCFLIEYNITSKHLTLYEKEPQNKKLQH